MSIRLLTALVICISEHKEDILQYAQKEALVEGIGNIGVGGSNVCNDLVANIKTHVGNVSHRVLESPYDTIHEEFKL
jgi:putative ribosome biogenesis GTPase RsgA